VKYRFGKSIVIFCVKSRPAFALKGIFATLSCSDDNDFASGGEPVMVLPRIGQHIRCANPACRELLDWAAPSAPRGDTPQRLIHEVSLPCCERHDFMCYACGHYTCVHPLAMRMERTSHYVELVVEARVVSSEVLHAILDYIEQREIRPGGHFLRLLIDIVAPQMSVTPMQALAVFRRAMKMGLGGSQVAYVITGRPWSITARIIERTARNRGVQLGFFVDRYSAERWLNSADEAGHTA
jgi:hypothetical protein